MIKTWEISSKSEETCLQEPIAQYLLHMAVHHLGPFPILSRSFLFLPPYISTLVTESSHLLSHSVSAFRIQRSEVRRSGTLLG